jgi:hypothetical protein
MRPLSFLVVFVNASMLLAFTASANISGDAVFKITSHDPSTSSKREGSTFVFRHEDRLYALSSDHVVFRGPAPYRHVLFHPILGTFEVDYLFSDWGRGISLFQFPKTAKDTLQKADIPAWSQLVSQRDFKDVPTRIMGYPAGSHSMLDLDQGLARAPLFISGILSSLNHMAYVQNSYAEYGMSGGPVFLPSGELLGLLSYLLLVGPTGGQTQEWESYSPAPILLIPLSEIQPVLQQFLDTHQYTSLEYVQPETASSVGELRLQTGRVEYSIFYQPGASHLSGVFTKLLPEPKTPKLPFDEKGRCFFRDFQAAMIRQNTPSLEASVPGFHFEKSFKFVPLNQVPITNFHQFVDQSIWANIRPILMWKEPDQKIWSETLKAFIGELDVFIYDRRISPEWKKTLNVMRESFQASVDRSGNRAWLGSSPGAVREVLINMEETPSDLEAFLKRVQLATGAYIE